MEPQSTAYTCQMVSAVQDRTTRAIMESHASAYAIELLRSCSPRAAAAWFDDHIRHNRVGLYMALEELMRAAGTSGPVLGIQHVLALADLALSVPLANIPAFVPPPDYVDSMLPYVRYEMALRDVESMANATVRLRKHRPKKYADPGSGEGLDQVVGAALAMRGLADPLLKLPVLPKRAGMEQNIAATMNWALQERRLFHQDSYLRLLERILIDALAYPSIRIFKLRAEMSTNSILFETTLDRFIMLARFCDWPVIEYDDFLEVFLCDPMKDPSGIVAKQITIFELSRIARRLLTERCPAVEGPSWTLSIGQQPLIQVIGVAAEQLTPVDDSG